MNPPTPRPPTPHQIRAKESYRAPYTAWFENLTDRERKAIHAAYHQARKRDPEQHERR